MRNCELCEKPTPDEDLCGDLTCRDCHKSLTFEDCVSGRWVDRQRAAAGLPPIEPKPFFETPPSSPEPGSFSNLMTSPPTLTAQSMVESIERLQRQKLGQVSWRPREREPVPPSLYELTASIKNILQDLLCRRGFRTPVTVTFHGEGRFFASAPIPIPRQVWEDVLAEGLYRNGWPTTVTIDPA